MDVVWLSRLQFTATTMFHFLFVPLTLGLSIFVAWMETKYVRTGDEKWLRMTKFWGKIFLINFAVGVVTGITLEFQFGTNWSGYSSYVGDIFGSLLAIEATMAFFLESTFIGIWIFGWKKLSKKAHAIVMWLVAIGGNISAIWILVANSWMQNPVGFVMRNGRAELTDFLAVVFQPYALLTIVHTLMASLLLAGFFIMGISAWHLLRKQHEDVFVTSFRTALLPTFIIAIALAIFGDFHAVDVAKAQPAKMAAMEFHWETKEYSPSYIFAWPDEEAENNAIVLGEIPGFLSFLVHHDFKTPVKGLKDIPKDERPPVAIVGFSFRVMVGLGMYFILVCGVLFWYRGRLTEKPFLLKLMVWSIPLPYIACQAGWIVKEVGRQPWIVHGLMKTENAASLVSVEQVFISLLAFILVYGLLGAAGFTMMAKKAKIGPEAASAPVSAT